jgi:multicomponent Na+:H+ antiporter subunit B
MDYVERTTSEIHIPNVVTAVLASYRGFDTFGEVVVIFAAGLGVLLLLGLNGNAGMWRARPNGVNISETHLPSAQSAKGESVASLVNKRKTEIENQSGEGS